MKTLALVAVVTVVCAAAAAAVSAGSSSAQMTVSVTVVRSCAVDTRPAEHAPQLRLTCTAGAQSTLRVAETSYAPSATTTSVGDRLLTLNF